MNALLAATQGDDVLVAQNIGFGIIAAINPNATFCATITSPPGSATTCDASADALTEAPS